MILNNNEIHKTYDNVELYITRDIVEDSRAIVLIVQELGECSGKYDQVALKLNNYKYSVYRFDNIGHGKSGEEIILINDYNKVCSYICEMVNIIKDENKDKPIFILGNSIGGMTVTLYGIKHPNEVSGVMLSSILIKDKEVKYIEENSKDLTYPVLVLQGLKDDAQNIEASKNLFNNIGFKYKKIKLYEDMNHHMLKEDMKDEVLIDINNWIRKELRYIK